MDLVQFMLILVVIGVLLWVVNNFIPMDRKIKKILNIVVVIGVILWVLNVFGIFNSLHGIRIGR
ncbi:MAG: Thivi_2564 family membrane protein [Desulfococcaceae bacterium]